MAVMKTKQQKLAEAEARASRLRLAIRADDTRQKIVVGGAIISLALKDASAARAILTAFDMSPPRDHDQKVVGELITKLRETVAKG